jgi:hypothetical protein
MRSFGSQIVTLDEDAATRPAQPPPSPESTRSTQGLLQSARDGWEVGGAAFDLARRARPLRPYVAGALAVVLLVEAGMAAGGVALRHEGTLAARIVFGLLAGYVVAVVSNAAAVGLAGLADELLAGGEPESALGWRLAWRRLPQVAGWALLVVAVGVPMRLLTRWGVDQLGAALLGFSWGVLTLFVVPAIALAGDGPMEAARRSLRLVSRRWETQIAGMVYVWVRPALFVGVPGAALLLTGVVLAVKGIDLLGWTLAAAGVVALAIAYALIVSATSILAVALFRYAEGKPTPAGFAPEQLERVMRGPSPTVLRVAQRLDGERARSVRSKLTGTPPS